jgi:hypothetical protein
MPDFGTALFTPFGNVLISDLSSWPVSTALVRASGRGQAGGAKNSSAIPSGSRKETPEP